MVSALSAWTAEAQGRPPKRNRRYVVILFFKAGCGLAPSLFFLLFPHTLAFVIIVPNMKLPFSENSSRQSTLYWALASELCIYHHIANANRLAPLYQAAEMKDPFFIIHSRFTHNDPPSSRSTVKRTFRSSSRPRALTSSR